MGQKLVKIPLVAESVILGQIIESFLIRSGHCINFWIRQTFENLYLKISLWKTVRVRKKSQKKFSDILWEKKNWAWARDGRKLDSSVFPRAYFSHTEHTHTIWDWESDFFCFFVWFWRFLTIFSSMRQGVFFNHERQFQLCCKVIHRFLEHENHTLRARKSWQNL